jgi:hypothetical protein
MSPVKLPLLTAVTVIVHGLLLLPLEKLHDFGEAEMLKDVRESPCPKGNIGGGAESCG